MRHLKVTIESWPIAGAFTISRGSRTEAVVVIATITQDSLRGRGECVPYARYGESADGVSEAIQAQSDLVARGCTHDDFIRALPAGAARNALDCALWDLEAKRAARPVWQLAGLPQPRPLLTCFTLSVGTADEMYRAAKSAAHRPLLKVKLAGAGDPQRIAAVRAGAPRARLVADANEAWTEHLLEENLAACAEAGVELIEQPLPAGQDAILSKAPRRIPLCADESLHDRGSLSAVAERYDAINIKLDKAGGFTEALRLRDAARQAGLKIMIGCMVGTSLAMAPAVVLAGDAEFVDLDGPLLLARDRDDALIYNGSVVEPPNPALWG